MGRALRPIPQELFFLVGWTGEPVLIIFARGLIKFYGRLDYACNNAKTFVMGRLFELSEEEWDRTINANLKGIWLSLKYQIPIMLQQKGG